MSRAQVKPNGYKVTYHSDGTGRDTYINRNSGGLYAPYVPRAGPGVSSFNTRRIPNAAPSPVIAPLAVHYYSDGSGRDSYISFNEGGLALRASFTDVKTAFKQSLRQNDY